MHKPRLKLTVCVLAIAVLGACSNLSASIVPCPTATTFDVLATSFDTLANACNSQDKLYYDFTYTPATGAPLAAEVSAGLIFQLDGVGIDIHGWNFGSAWSNAGFTISYTIEVCPTTGDPCSASVVPGTVITAADAVYAPSALNPPGNETIVWSGPAIATATATLTDASPGPAPSTADIGVSAGVLGPITVTATFSGIGTITQTTLRFYESVPATAVPEGSTFALVLGGVALIAASYGWRKHTRRS
jgi:hypothetical protein